MHPVASLDPLESRVLLSAPPAPTVQNGILKVFGTPADDTIEVEYFTFAGGPRGADATPLYGVYVDGTTTVVPDNGIVGVHVHSGKGNDVIKLIDVDPNLISVSAPAGVNYSESSVAVPETVFGGTGNNVIDAGYPNPNPNLVTTGYGTGPVAIHGGGGNDTISANYGIIYGGRGNDSITAGFNTTVVAGRGNDSIDIGTYTNDVISGVGGNDTIVGRDTIGGTMPG